MPWATLYSGNLCQLQDSFWRRLKFGGAAPIQLSGRVDQPPFFIIGSGRSGNTLLRRILTSHPEVHIPPETYFLGTLVSNFIRNPQRSWKQHIREFLIRFARSPDYPAFGLELNPLGRELLTIPPEEQSLASLLDQFYHYHAQKMGLDCLRWGDKTPTNTFHLHHLQQVFPRAHFIHIVRDGFDVINSYLQSGISSSLDQAAMRWATTVRLAAAFCLEHPRWSFTLRYETLVQSPEATIRLVCEFLGLQFQPSMLEASSSVVSGMGDIARHPHHRKVMDTISSQYVGRGLQNLENRQVARIQYLVSEELELAAGLGTG